MGRIRDYVKYSRGELENYTKVPDSCVKRINTTTHLEFPPFGLKNFKDSLMQIISQRKIGFYDEHMKGIILDIRNIKVLSNFAAVRFDTPGLHIDMRADFYIFQPHVGAKIKGIVKHVSHRQIGVIVYRVFSVKIILQEDVQNNIELNSEVEFRIKDFDLQNVIPFIEGELTNEVGDSSLAPVVSMERDSENEDISQWPKSGSFLTSTQIPQKTPQKTEKKDYRGSDKEGDETNSEDSTDNRTMTNNSRTIPMKAEEESSDDEENSTHRPQYEEITVEKSEILGADENSDNSECKSSANTVIVSTNSCKKARDPRNVARKQEHKMSDDESDKNCDEISIGKTEISNVDYPHISTDDTTPLNGCPEETKRTNSPNIFAPAEETDSDESISQIGPSQAPQSLTRIRGSGKSSKISGSGNESQSSFKSDDKKHSPEKKEQQKKSKKALKNLSDEADGEKVIFSAEVDLHHEEQSQSIESSNPLLDFIESVKAEKNPIKARDKNPVIKKESTGNTSDSKRKRERKLSEMDQSLLNIFNKIKREKRASESDRSDNESSIFLKPDPKALPSPASKIRKSRDKANISESSSAENSVGNLSSTVIFQKPGSDADTAGKNESKENTQNSNFTPSTLIKEYVSGSDTDTGRKKRKKGNTHSSDSLPEIVVKEEIFISDTDTESKKKKVKGNRTFDLVPDTVVKEEVATSDTDTGRKKKKKKRDQPSDSTAQTIVQEENPLNGSRLRVTPESDASGNCHINNQKQHSVTSPTDHTQNTSPSKKRVSFSVVKQEIEFVDDGPVKRESPTVESVKRRLDLNEINGEGSFSNKHDKKKNVSLTGPQENGYLTTESNLIKKRKRKHEQDLSSDINNDVPSDNIHEMSSREAPPKPKKKKKSSETSLADSLANILLQVKKNKLNKSLEKESRKSNGNDTSLANASAFSSPGLSSTKLDIKSSK